MLFISILGKDFLRLMNSLMESVNYILGKGASVAVCISKILSASFFSLWIVLGSVLVISLRYLY